MLKNQEEETQRYKLRPDTIILAGTAKLPEKIRPKDSVGYLAIYLEVDPINSEIVDVSSTLLPSQPPPPQIRLFFPILILISKKYFQKSPILLQIKKKLLIKNSEAAYCHL